MNERIHDLAMLARKHFPKTETSGEFWVIDEAKFAELIVRQMLDIADAHTEVFQTDRDRALIEHIKQSVKQHFGVEE